MPSITLTLLKSDSPYGRVLGGVNLVPRAFFLNRKGKGKREKALETRLKFFGSLTVSGLKVGRQNCTLISSFKDSGFFFIFLLVMKSLTCCVSIHSWLLLIYCSSCSRLRIHRCRHSYLHILGSRNRLFLLIFHHGNSCNFWRKELLCTGFILEHGLVGFPQFGKKNAA